MGGPVRAPLSVPRQTWNFVRHFLEMCISMCVGVGLIGFALRISDAFGFPDPLSAFPALSLLAVAVLLTLPMIAWMRVRGMPWRPILEMAIAGIVLAVVAAIAGIIPVTPVSAGTVCSVECVAMVVVMLFRLDLYTGRAGHHALHGHAQA